MTGQRPSRPTIPNTDYVVLALLLSGGAERYVSLEHIAVTCYQLAPLQFRWNLYDYPSLETAQHGARDLLRRNPDLLRKPETQASAERMLTAAGIRRAVEIASLYMNRRFERPADVISAFAKEVTDDRTTINKRAGKPTDNRPAQQEIRFIRKHETFTEWRQGTGLETIEKWRYADLLKCLPDSPGNIWQERLERLQAQAAWWQDDEVAKFLKELQQTINGRT